MKKLDLKLQLPKLYKPKAGEYNWVNVPSLQFLVVEGLDARPEQKGFQDNIQSLFSLSYRLKFRSKNTLGLDYGVMPLEGLWWADDMDVFLSRQKELWKYRLMILQPEWITAPMVEEEREILFKKKGDLVGLHKTQLLHHKEGTAIQYLHIGPFENEGPAIQNMHQMIRDQGHSFEVEGLYHHEIYLSDFRRAAPEKLRTILRQPYLNQGGIYGD